MRATRRGGEPLENCFRTAAGLDPRPPSRGAAATPTGAGATPRGRTARPTGRGAAAARGRGRTVALNPSLPNRRGADAGRRAEEDPPANRRGVFIDPEELTNVQLVQVFLAYSYLLYVGCNMISDGAELLMLTPFRPGR